MPALELKMESGGEKQDWLGVIARSLAYLCIQNSHLKEKTTAQKAVFLNSIGLSKSTIADMLESTPQSIAELIRLSKSRKGSRGAKKKVAKNGKGKGKNR